MHYQILAQVNNEFLTGLLAYFAVGYCFFVVNLFLFRAIFNIPSFLRLQKAQVRLLTEIAKAQGVDNTTMKYIVSESIGWDTLPEVPKPPQGEQQSV